MSFRSLLRLDLSGKLKKMKRVYQKNSIEDIESKVILYTNSFLDNNYENLPELVNKESPLIERKEMISNVNSFFSFSILLLYTLFPISIILLFKQYFNINIPEIIQPTISILYIAWITLGLITYFNRLAPDAKKVVIELLGIIFRR